MKTLRLYTRLTVLRPQVLILGIVAFFGGNMRFDLAYFTPTIIHGMGYSPVRKELVSVPSFVTTFVTPVGILVFSDRWGQRCYVFSSLGFLPW